jgi:hypothetical protein
MRGWPLLFPWTLEKINRVTEGPMRRLALIDDSYRAGRPKIFSLDLEEVQCLEVTANDLDWAIQGLRRSDPPPATTLNSLPRNDCKILQALADLGACRETTAVTRESITAKAGTGAARSRHNRASFKRLSNPDRNLIDAKPRIGTWLTPQGASLITPNK